MAGKSRLLDARVVSIAKKELKKLGQYGYVSRKLHAVIAASRHSIAEVAKVYDISRTTLISWIKHISESGVEQLKAPPGRHRKTKLSTSQLETVDSFIIDDPNITIRALRAKIEETFGVLLGKSTVHRIMRQKYSHITPRPKHYQQDRSQVEEFKKNMREMLDSNAYSDASILFFDESRFGTHSKVGRCWLPTGVRSPVDIKLGFQNFYLYSSVNAKTGETFSLMMPTVNTACMNVYLSHLAGELVGKNTILIMDGAGWHKSRTLVVPSNIKIIHLPPYSPELNPVERLWLYIKKSVLYNKIYKDIKDLEEAVCAFVRELTSNKVSTLCTAHYLFNQ